MLFQILSRGFLFVQWQSLATLLFHLSGTKIVFFLFNQKKNILLVIDFAVDLFPKHLYLFLYHYLCSEKHLFYLTKH